MNPEHPVVFLLDRGSVFGTQWGMRLKTFHDISARHWLGAPPKRADKKAEPIRQWLLSELAQSYSYPICWLQQRLQLVGGRTARGAPGGFFGFALVTASGDPFLWASIAPANAALAESRLREILRSAPFSRRGICTDGSLEGTRILRQRSNSEVCDFVPDLETFLGSSAQNSSGCFRAPGGNANPGQELEPISASLEEVFFQAHSHIRDIDGLHADEALDELCKILYAKREPMKK